MSKNCGDVGMSLQTCVEVYFSILLFSLHSVVMGTMPYPAKKQWVRVERIECSFTIEPTLIHTSSYNIIEGVFVCRTL